MNQELNQLLDQVYDLQDISSEVGKDLEQLIFQIVEQVEYLVELEDQKWPNFMSTHKSVKNTEGK